ncbi:hypothetical protein TRICI_001557 [Trichomonascus ciferrii]|uniref:Major facilitator superfamily (MFS) profile domain-containing protein n=1 Tax=Trichomonascus ciferrii TaxID=44093 RepID=A0A642VCC5_9ASCO|nr:hypothetical protein TRICI_001557 [Trichomonascus ciferrii]
MSQEIIDSHGSKSEEPEKDESKKPDDGDEAPHSVYLKTEKLLIVAMASFASFFSSVSSPIYLPAIPQLEVDFNQSTEMINLTITMYSIFQGLGPAFWSPIADSLGRRPVYIMCFVIYIGANIGLALSRWYWMLFALRCVQAAGIASTVAIGAGLVADITERKERGMYMGIFTGLGLIGNAFGPLIGGGLDKSLGWRSIFWFLVIAAGTVLAFIIFSLPETNRFIAGNGSVIPDSVVNKSPYIFFRRKLTGVPCNSPKEAGLERHPLNILYSLRLFRYKDVIIVLIPNAIHYTAWFMMITAQSSLLSEKYHFNSSQIGLSYLSSGVGSIVGSLSSGKLMQIYYKKCMNDYKNRQQATGNDTEEFNIQKARLGISFYPCFGMICACIVFGWTIQYNVHYVVPLLATAVASFTSITLINFVSTLLVDLFPKDSASSTASVNLSRCLVCAAGIAAVDSMMDAMGPGGAFTLMAGFCGLSMVCVVVELKYGPRWDRERRETTG